MTPPRLTTAPRPPASHRSRPVRPHALLARMKRQARTGSRPRTMAYQRAVILTPTVCSAGAVSLSRRVALRPKDRSGAVAASGVSRQPRL